MTSADPVSSRSGLPEIFLVFLRLGLTSFGGPIAHLGYFRHEFVDKRRWLDDAAYADIVALCQFLPGPASSQVGMSVGLLRAGVPGALAAWLGFTAPSAILMILFGYGVTALSGLVGSAWLHGLMIVAVAVVAQAVWSMARALCPDAPRASLAITAAALVMLVPVAAGQIGVIALGGVIGWLFFRPAQPEISPLPALSNTSGSAAALLVFLVLLVCLPAVAFLIGSHTVALFDSFYRAGALVFGGGHVVLPLLQAAVVPPGWVSNADFLAGYGAAQAVPGPLFTFAAYLGTVARLPPNGWLGGVLCLVAIFLPSFLLVLGALPLWSRWRHSAAMRAALMGINAAVVGLLLAALYNPVWVSAIFSLADFALAVTAFLLLTVARVPPWLVVILGAAAAAIAQ